MNILNVLWFKFRKVTDIRFCSGGQDNFWFIFDARTIDGYILIVAPKVRQLLHDSTPNVQPQITIMMSQPSKWHKYHRLLLATQSLPSNMEIPR